MLTRVEFIKQQLSALSPGADWNLQGVDRLQELAEVFDRNGITDLWQLKLIPAEYVHVIPAWTEYSESDTVFHPESEQIVKGYAFDYYGRRIGFLGGPDEVVNEPIFEQTDLGFSIAWSARGHGNVGYYVRPNKQKTALEIVPVWGSSSDAAYVRGSLITAIAFFVSALLPVMGTAIGATVGSAVVPASFAAAYPGVTAAIGNIAISTALNGGNVEAAVKGAALSYVGGIAGAQAGGFAFSATDSQLIGSLADVAARTAIVGGDIKQAVGISLLNQGATSMFNFDTQPAYDLYTQTFDADITSGGFGYGDEVLNFGLDDFGVNPVVDFTLPDLPGDFYFEEPNPLELPQNQSFDTFVWNPFVSEETPAALVAADTPNTVPPFAPTVPPPANSPAFSPTNVVQGITNAILLALQVVKAYRALDNPTVQSTARAVRPNGAVSVIGDNGLIQTRTTAGQVTAAKPPVGVPQATLSGNYIVNNGDGSYNVISPTGQSARYLYSADAPKSGEVSPWLIGGGLLAAFLVLKGR